MPRYKIVIEYDGTNFHGWQRQDNGISIQGLIESAILKFSQEETTVIGSGRTDAGVHAIGQVAHFDLTKSFPGFTVMRAINHYLKPHLIAVQNCEPVNDEFHARFSAVKRYYFYRIINRPGKIVIDQNKAWHIIPSLNIKLMKEAALYFIGTHDFTSFRTVHCQAKSPIKTINELKIEQFNEEIRIFISAPSFLHHMVRNIIGALVDVGLSKLNPQDIEYLIQVKDRKKAPATAPACGLYFSHVEY